MQRNLILLAYFFICANCLAQQFPFVQYTPKDGLINSRVRKAYQDSKGRIYFLTFSGLSVYDGARFKNYTKQNGLSEDLINDILEIGNDSFLVAANINSLNILINGRMTVLKTGSNFCPLINQFYRNDKNEIYVSSDDGLFAFKNNQFKKLNILPFVTNDITSPYLGAITGFGDYLIFTTNDLKRTKGLYLYDIKNDRICDMLTDKTIAGLTKDWDNNIWVSMPDKLSVLDNHALARGKLVLVSPPAPYYEIENSGFMTPSFDANGMWVIQGTKKIIHIEKNGSVAEVFLPEQIILYGGIRNILIDRENTMWLCNDGAGVFKLANSRLQIFENPAGKQVPVYYYQVFPSKNGAWYTSTGNKVFRKSANELTEFTCNLKTAPFLFKQSEKKLMGYDLHNIYEGIVREDTRQIYFHKIISLPDSDNFGKRLILDPYGNIIAALRSGISVWKNNKLIFHTPIAYADLIEELTFDKNGVLWSVNRYKTLEAFSLHPEDPLNYLQQVFHIPKDFVDISPRCSVFDKEGLLWVGTRTHGVFAYRYENKRLKELYHFETGNGLMDNFVTALACDSSNNIIVGTQTGLDRIIRDTSYPRIENLTNSINFFAYINQVWTDGLYQSYALTNTGGLLKLSPVIKNNNNSPQLLIEELRVNAHPLLQEKSIFSFKENNISFSVAAPSFVDEKQIRFSYLLEGSGNKQWSDTSTSNSVINLINLPAGKYFLKVKAFFPSTPYVPAESSFYFRITPPWWQTWWFRIIAGFVVIGLLVTGFRSYYQRKLEKQKMALEKQQAIEKERTRIATDMHDDLGAGLSRIKFLSETIGIKKQQQQPIEEDISKIREYSHEMIDKMGEIVWALNEKNDSLSDLLSYTRSYAVEYLSQNGIACNVTVQDNLSATFVSGEFRRNIFLSVKEALHNVVKHSQADYVSVNIHAEKQLTISIQDNGIGFDKKNIRAFSNGIYNIEKRMKDINGLADVQNNIGTKIVLLAPLS